MTRDVLLLVFVAIVAVGVIVAIVMWIRELRSAPPSLPPLFYPMEPPTEEDLVREAERRRQDRPVSSFAPPAPAPPAPAQRPEPPETPPEAWPAIAATPIERVVPIPRTNGQNGHRRIFADDVAHAEHVEHVEPVEHAEPVEHIERVDQFKPSDPFSQLGQINRADEGQALSSETVRFLRPMEQAVQLLPGRLEVISGDSHHREIRFVRVPGRPAEIILGREGGPTAQYVALSSSTVSRRHAHFSYVDGQWFVRNLSRTNPLIVNDDELSDSTFGRMLADGDRLELGEVVLCFHAQ